MTRFLALLILLVPAVAGAQTISGGLDARYTTDGRLHLRGVFLNFRNVWSDEAGDRWIGVAQVDAEDDLSRIHPYQVYAQYKGPLGRWNVRAGHFLMPAGLLATFDTERIPLGAIDESSIGLRRDTGAQLFGRAGSLDYAVALTTGLGDHRLWSSAARGLATARVALVRDHWQTGISVLTGSIEHDGAVVKHHRLIGDATFNEGPFTVRAEVFTGNTGQDHRTGGLLLSDVGLTPRLELNTRYAHDGDEQYVAVGASFQIRPSLWLRAAETYSITEGHYETSIQIYYDFSRTF